MRLPNWITMMPVGCQERRKAELNFKVRVAALYATEAGTVLDLTMALQCTQSAIWKGIHKGDLSKGMAARIEAIVGRDVITKEELCTKYR